MPAPLGIFGQNIKSEPPIDIESDDGEQEASSGTINGNQNQSTFTSSRNIEISNQNQQISINTNLSTSPSPHMARELYDETFISRPVTEVKCMLWEIQNFDMIFSEKVERSMNFEFEVGRLGSMERHLPRRSRWKIMLDVNDPYLRTPALRVFQLSPENKTLFYKLEACILDGTQPAPEQRETEFKIKTEYQEGSSKSSAFNIFSFQSTSCNFVIGGTEFLDKIRNDMVDGSLFVKVRMEILEDSSTTSQ